MKTLIVIAGPTACGKTAISVQIAQKLQTEIVSCDSRQFYKELSIGTAKPTPSEMDGVVHHFVDSHSILEEINAGKFERLALPVIHNIFKKKDFVILTGGSGLFMDAVTHGFDDMPSIPPKIREELRTQFNDLGLDPLVKKLLELDPEYAQKVDLSNPQRIIRALEICLSSGKTYTELRNGQKEQRPFKILKIVLDRPREELYQRINKRVDIMLKMGLENEVLSLKEHQHLNALNTVGYKEIFDLFDSVHSKKIAIELIKRNSRRYAKRQLTWFRRDASSLWINPENLDQIMETIKNNAE